ncbi:MAG: ABC transporter permease [Gammaproteobacteria bacterium]|nr:ABC transporter permease [Gammaproteobacteria bacterium]
MLRRVLAIARFTVLEGVRSRLLATAGVLGLACIALAEFAASIALTETHDYRIALLAAALRSGAAFLVATIVIAGSVRDFQSGVAALLLSRPLSRPGYFLGRLLGHGLLAGALAAAAGALLAVYTDPAQALFWALSLGCELVLVVAFAQLCAVSFSQLPAALGAVAAFYLLARAIGAIQLLSSGVLADGGGLLQRGAAWFAHMLGYLLPDIWRFADAGWLVHGSGTWAALAPLATQTAIYLVLLSAVGMFDLYRREL